MNSDILARFVGCPLNGQAIPFPDGFLPDGMVYGEGAYKLKWRQDAMQEAEYTWLTFGRQAPAVPPHAKTGVSA